MTVAELSLGWIAHTALVGNSPKQKSIANLWKHGIATPTILIILTFSFRVGSSRPWIALALSVVVAVSAVAGFRSHAFICVLVSLIVVVAGSCTRRRKASLALIVLASAHAIFPTPKILEVGLFGEESRFETIQQAAGGTSLLLAGRSEPPLSFVLISEHPVLGWGNIGQLQVDQFQRAIELASSLGLTNKPVVREYLV